MEAGKGRGEGLVEGRTPAHKAGAEVSGQETWAYTDCPKDRSDSRRNKRKGVNTGEQRQ